MDKAKLLKEIQKAQNRLQYARQLVEQAQTREEAAKQCLEQLWDNYRNLNNSASVAKQYCQNDSLNVSK